MDVDLESMWWELRKIDYTAVAQQVRRNEGPGKEKRLTVSLAKVI